MATVDLHATGTADPDAVWERYADLSRWPDWAPQIRAVRADGDVLRPGLHGVVVGPVGVRVDFVVADVDPVARRWTWRVRLGPIRLRLTHGVESDPEGVRTTLRVTGPLPVLIGYCPVAQVALWRLVET